MPVRKSQHAPGSAPPTAPTSSSSGAKNSVMSHSQSTGIPRRSTFSPGDNRAQPPAEKARPPTNGQDIRRWTMLSLQFPLPSKKTFSINLFHLIYGQ
jgi:hypothetical protein